MDERKKTVCRVCLRIESGIWKCLSLFEIYNGSFISEKINSLVSFTIQKDDGFPEGICPDCLLELENAILFREKCENSNQMLYTSSFQNEEMIDIKVEAEDCIDATEELPWLEEVVHDDEHRKRTSLSLKEPNKKSKAINLELICNDCGESYKSKCKLKVHWKKIHLPKILLCGTCKRQFKSFKAFNRHKKNGTRICAIAEEMRIEGTGKSRVFHCKECEYKTEHFKNLKAHLVTHTGARPYLCNICSKGFSQMSSLQGHKEIVHKQYRVETTCQYCGKLIKGRARLYKHMRSHQDAKFQCDHCKKMFRSRESLKIHTQRHSGYKSYTCEVCAASFYTVSDLFNHKRRHHSEFEKGACEICGYETRTISAMYRHKKKHTDTNICCKLCGKFVNSEQEFVEHKKFHYGKKYCCPSCERTYNSKKSLRKHLISVHTPKIGTALNTFSQKIIIKKESSQSEN